MSSDIQVTAPVYTCLMVPRTVGKVDRRLFYANLAVAVFLLAVAHFAWLAAINVLIHVLAMWITKRHPNLIGVYLKYRNQGDHYRPWVSPTGWVRNRRPEGFNRF